MIWIAIIVGIPVAIYMIKEWNAAEVEVQQILKKRKEIERKKDPMYGIKKRKRESDKLMKFILEERIRAKNHGKLQKEGRYDESFLERGRAAIAQAVIYRNGIDMLDLLNDYSNIENIPSIFGRNKAYKAIKNKDGFNRYFSSLLKKVKIESYGSAVDNFYLSYEKSYKGSVLNELESHQSKASHD